MKWRYTVLALLMCVCSVAYAEAENLSKYRLKEYNTVEEFQNAYLNKIITYMPIEQPIVSGSHITELEQHMGLGYDFRSFIVTSITGKTKKNRDWLDMEWTIEEVGGNFRKTFKVHSGNYTQEIYYYNKDKEFLLRELQFYMLDEWREDHKMEIGQVFENPFVKAKYEVTDVYLVIEKDPDDYYNKKIIKKYTVQNTLSGEKADYFASKAETLCFIEDLSGDYQTSLAKVEKPENPSVQYGNTTIVEDEGKTKYSYEDNFISIIIFGTSTKFYFTLKNVSNNSLKLLWDEAVYVDYNGSTSRVMHNGIKYSEREASQAASTIIRGATLEDIVCPTANVYWDEYRKDWDLHLMYPDKVSLETKQVQLMLPIQIKDVVNEYIFVFDIKYEFNHPERLNLP